MLAPVRILSALRRRFGSEPQPYVATAKPRPSDFIDVAALIRDYDPAEHARRADAYFAKMTDPTPILRKPFAYATESQELMTGLGALLPALDLFLHCRILDFGCGVGWLSRALAHLGCQVTAVDISPAALAIGAAAFNADPVSKGLSVDWKKFDGARIPLADGSMDRVICFDAFHHVADQAPVLAEIARVLAPGGIAAFHEPGPFHSWFPQSQAEMRDFGVIENDIHICEIEKLALSVGFARLELLTYARRTKSFDVATYETLVGNRGDASAYEALGRAMMQDLADLRVFTLHKQGETIRDSRDIHALAGTIGLRWHTRDGNNLRCGFRVENTGRAIWLRSEMRLAAVNLGVQLVYADGSVKELPTRAPIADLQTEPGTALDVTSDVTVPDGVVELRFFLVSELVGWFGKPGLSVRLD
jgi:SAM-dependent methyltransferase